MKDEYIVINKTAILKRIEEINKQIPEYKNEPYEMILREEKNTLEDVLSQSTPLIPEIEKAFDEAFDDGITASFSDSVEDIKLLKKSDKQDYISNLKLDV